jgi:hypothetical protein
MPDEIEVFLTAYTPRFICLTCGAVTGRDKVDVHSVARTHHPTFPPSSPLPSSGTRPDPL